MYMQINDIYFKYIWAGRRICSTPAQKAELKVVGVFDVRTWGGAGVSVLVCTRIGGSLGVVQ